jgi:arylsulfatase
MPRRNALPAPGLLLFALLGLAGCGGRGDPRPDLLLVTVDTLRADALACYGGAPDVGESLCALAGDGTRFTWAFSAAPSTAPSVASIFTSRYPRDHGVTQHATSALATDAKTLATVLANAGYATAAFVANPVLRRGRGFEQGFAIYDDRMTRRERNRPELLEREAGELTDEALAWARVARRPWFLWLHYQDPHGPYEPPGAAPARDEPGATLLPLLDDQTGWRGIPAYQALGVLRSAEAYRARYLDEIRWLDGHVARLVAALDARDARPVVIVTADHGEALGEDEFWFAHGHSVGLDQVRVPLLWRRTRPAAPTVVASPVSTLDVASTLLSEAGIPVPADFAGRPLPADSRPDPGASERVLFAEHRWRLAVVAGAEYYARDREPWREPRFDRIAGGVVPPLPPRSAHLAPDGAAPRYVDARPDDPLEPQAQGFLAETARRRVAATEAPAPDAGTREALRALGYLE